MILAIIQARLSSRRLPGKVLMPILGKPMLLRQLERIQRATLIDKLLVATSDEPSDDAIADCCASNNIAIFRGSLNDVLDRYYQAAMSERPDHVVRLTADCPLTDPMIIDEVIRLHLKDNSDYTSNVNPPTFADGLDVEIMNIACLEKLWHLAKTAYDREHVTVYARRQPAGFRLSNYTSVMDYSQERWTVDEVGDFQFVSEVYDHLYPRKNDFLSEDILNLLKDYPSHRIEKCN